MTQKTKDMLDSEDLEMVRLGVHIMKQEVEKSMWQSILQAYSFKGGEDYKDLYVRKWEWEINGDDIIISPLFKERSSKLYTGAGGMKLFEDAMKKQFNIK